jgi:predicted ATPase
LIMYRFAAENKKDLIIVHRLFKIYLRSNVVMKMTSVTHPSRPIAVNVPLKRVI